MLHRARRFGLCQGTYLLGRQCPVVHPYAADQSVEGVQFIPAAVNDAVADAQVPVALAEGARFPWPAARLFTIDVQPASLAVVGDRHVVPLVVVHFTIRVNAAIAALEQKFSTVGAVP